LVDFLIANRFQLSKNGGIKPDAYRRTAGSMKFSVKNFMQAAQDVGGPDRDRTDDIQLAKLALSQLSYGPSASAIRDRWWA
jgi:hypothetical protein